MAREVKEFAAVDLGSNSFHLVLARVENGELTIVDKLKERVRLASGLDEKGYLSEASQSEALLCLERFGHRLAHIDKSHVRVVGTNTLRKAKNADTFVQSAEKVIGQQVEIISGLEEARLIHSGVANLFSQTGENYLIVDIGGGSTECIIGRDRKMHHADSFYMGCVEFSNQYFSKSKWSRKDFDRAVTAARLQMGPVQRVYRELGWTRAFGSSGTINAVSEILNHQGFGQVITRSGIDWLFGYLQGAKSVDALDLPGLKPERAPVIVGGVCILWALFHSLKLREMHPVQTALREGVLNELANIEGQSDVREHSVSNLMKRYSVDETHAALVVSVVNNIGPALLGAWTLDADEYLPLIRWAAQLHEIGKCVQYSGYHKHSAYLVSNSHLAGFDKHRQQILAAMLLVHRRKIDVDRLTPFVGDLAVDVAKMSTILRLSVLLCRTRSDRARPHVDVKLEQDRIELLFPTGYLETRPLTRADLEQENVWLRQIGLSVKAHCRD